MSLLEEAKKYEIKVERIHDRFSDISNSIGAGQFGSVHAATDRTNGDRVALKLLTTPNVTRDTIEEFNRVARIPMSEFIVNYRDILVVIHGDGTPQLAVVMDLIVGTELFDVIDKMRSSGKRFDNDQLFNIFYTLLPQVHKLHRHGVAHRDIKPKNIMIREKDGLPVLVDLGLACIGQECEERYGGTLVYMPPDFWASPTPVATMQNLESAKGGDIFALGCVFFECCYQLRYEKYVRRVTGRNTFEVYAEQFRKSPNLAIVRVPDDPNVAVEFQHVIYYLTVAGQQYRADSLVHADWYLHMYHNRMTAEEAAEEAALFDSGPIPINTDN